MSNKGTSPLVIYLDQKCWIELAKIYYGAPKDTAFFTKLELAVSEKRVIFPITLTNFDETLRINNQDRRDKLADLMVRLSQGFSFQPYLNRIIRLEIINVVLERLHLPVVDIKKVVLKRGQSNLLGAKGALVPKPGAKLLSDEVKAQISEIVESDWALNYIMKISPTVPNRINQSYIDQMEKERNNLFRIKDTDLRFRFFIANSMIDMILPELARITARYNLSPDLIITPKMSRPDIDLFLNSIPTALSLFTLTYYRDQQLQRRIQPNDFNDIWFLSLAIPYSDVVVTERMWSSICSNSKLAEKCATKVYWSISDLDQFL